MARANLTLDLSALDKIIGRIGGGGGNDGPRTVIGAFEEFIRDKGLVALVSQAIADNFAQEGPGWAPLKGATIRNSLSKAMAKRLMRAAGLNAAIKMGATKKDRNGQTRIDTAKLKGKRKEYYARMDQEIEAMERRDRAATTPSGQQALGSRQILRRSGLLFDTVTTPNANATFSESDPVTHRSRSGQNITKVVGRNLIYGTNLVYAATHQYGDEERNIPARPYLVIREQWKKRIEEFMIRKLRANINGILNA